MQFHLMVIDKKENIHKILQIHYPKQLRDCNKKHISIALSLMFFIPNTSL